MKRSFIIMGSVLGLLTSLVSIAVSFLGNYLFSLPFLPFDLFEGLTRPLPGVIVEAMIRSMVSVISALHLGPVDTTAKLAEQLQGLGLVVITGLVFGLVLSWMALLRKAWLMRAALLGGLLLSLGMAVVEISLSGSTFITWLGIFWLLILRMGWSVWLYRLVKNQLALLDNPQQKKNYLSQTLSESLTRRDFLRVAWSSLASVVVILIGIEKSRSVKMLAPNPLAGITPAPVPVINLPYGPQYTSGPAASPSLDVLNSRLAAAPGTRDEITPVDQFFRVDINLEPPNIDAASWRLVVKGLVQNPTSYTLADLVTMPTVTQAVTIACISNSVGGSLIGGNYWTGVPLKTILDQVGLQSNALAVSIGSADGYYESLPMAEAMDERTLLVYAMNGQALTAKHGYPMRIYIPNHFGMKQPKWITGLEVIDNPGGGYWVERGWSQTAVALTTSIIDTRTIDKVILAKDGVFPLGGIAYAGARQIKKVELQFGDSPWVEAELRDPPVSPVTWVQWRYDWKPTPGTHQVKVRATDGDGKLQEENKNFTSFPEGAVGLDEVNFEI
jgi:DMSO/TMAO reductase YedYZ molybdopterin-dependent catalytic subunit